MVEHGAQGTGLFATEHFHSQTSFPALANDYDNCFYICRYCNGSKGERPVQADDGRTLLNPCLAAWGEHFEYDENEFRLEPRTADARYTEEAYRLNVPRKVNSRRTRFRVISEKTETLKNGPGRVKSLTDLLPGIDAEGRRVLFREILRQRQAIVNSRRDLERYLRVPKDAPASCRCP